MYICPTCKLKLILEIKEYLDNSTVDSLSLLMERDKISCIKQKKGQTIFSKSNFTLDVYDKNSIQKKIEPYLNKGEKYSFIDMSIVNDEFTLIPLEYFEEDLAEIFLNYNVPYSENKGLRFSWVPKFDLVIVFYYPEEVENYFKELTDKIRITHTGFKFLSKISENKQDGFYICTYTEYLEVVVVKNKTLLIYNVYPYKKVQDIVYFLQIISKNISVSLAESTLYYYGNLEKKIDYISSYVKTIQPGSDNRFELEHFTTLDIL